MLVKLIRSQHEMFPSKTLHPAGNLTAMITRPKLDKTINNAEDLLNQNEFEWGIGEGYGVEESMRQAQIGSTPRSLIEQGDHESKNKYY